MKLISNGSGSLGAVLMIFVKTPTPLIQWMCCRKLEKLLQWYWMFLTKLWFSFLCLQPLPPTFPFSKSNPFVLFHISMDSLVLFLLEVSIELLVFSFSTMMMISFHVPFNEALTSMLCSFLLITLGEVSISIARPRTFIFLMRV